MAMEGSGLASAVKAAIAALSDEDRKDHDAIWNAIGDAIVQYIQDNAQVFINVTTKDGWTATTAQGSAPVTGTKVAGVD